MNSEDYFAHIVGIGNLTRLDDGIAIRIIQELQRRNIPKNIKVTDLGTGGIDIILALDGWKKGIIIDAVDFEELEPGEIVEFIITEKSIPQIEGLSSTHGIDALTALKLAYSLKDYKLPKEIFLIGIQIKNIDGLGEKISNEVMNAIPIVIKKIEEKLNYKF